MQNLTFLRPSFFTIWILLAVPSTFVQGMQESEYDEALAISLGADDYGMKSYVMVILNTGPVTVEDEQKRNEVFRGHFANMKKMAQNQQLVIAGPFSNSAPKRGLFILNTDDVALAEKWVKSDPAVKAGVFSYELSNWYGSAALMQINSIHTRIQKNSIE